MGHTKGGRVGWLLKPEVQFEVGASAWRLEQPEWRCWRLERDLPLRGLASGN